MHQAIGELAVVGQNDETGGLEIQASDRNVPAQLLSKVIGDGGASLRIVQGRYHVLRFVKERHAAAAW